MTKGTNISLNAKEYATFTEAVRDKVYDPSTKSSVPRIAKQLGRSEQYADALVGRHTFSPGPLREAMDKLGVDVDVALPPRYHEVLA